MEAMSLARELGTIVSNRATTSCTVPLSWITFPSGSSNSQVAGTMVYPSMGLSCAMGT